MKSAGTVRTVPTALSGAFEKIYRGYCEALLSVDDSIGRVSEELQRLGPADDTLLVYTGDNGYFHEERADRQNHARTLHACSADDGVPEFHQEG